MKYIIHLRDLDHELYGDGYIEHYYDGYGFFTVVHDKGRTVVTASDILYVLISTDLEFPKEK